MKYLVVEGRAGCFVSDLVAQWVNWHRVLDHGSSDCFPPVLSCLLGSILAFSEGIFYHT